MKKKKARRKINKSDVAELLLWIPELILYPLRLIIWIIRGVGRLVRSVFDTF